MNTEQNKITIDLYKRLAVIGNKIFKKKNEDQIIEKLTAPKPKIATHLELIYLLIEDNCSLSKIFWDAFVSAQSSFSVFNNSFDIEEIYQLVKLADENDRKHNSEESAQLSRSLKEFINTNGLLEQADPGYVSGKDTLIIPDTENEDVKTMKVGVVGVSTIDEEEKNSVISLYKKYLLNSILLIHGITIRNHSTSTKRPSKELVDYLVKRNLIRKLTAEEEAIKKKAMNEIKKMMGIRKKEEDHIQKEEGHETYDELLTSEEFCFSADIVHSRLSDFCKLIDSFPKRQLRKINTFSSNFMKLEKLSEEYHEMIPERMITNIHFDLYLKKAEEKADTDLKLEDGFDKALSDSLKVFLSIVEARMNLELCCYFNEKVPTGEIGFFNDSEDTNPAVRAKFKTILDINDLALLAGINNLKSIKNEAAKKDGYLKRSLTSESYFMGDSAKLWLNDTKKRKYTFFDLIPLANLTDDEITLDDLRKIHAD